MPQKPPAHPSGTTPPPIPKKFIPQHVAVVMDGNGRWANERGLPRNEGHRAGEAALLDIVAGAIEMGIPYISAYAFSTENWKRSPSEVSFIMRFSTEVLNRQLETLKSWGVRIRWAGAAPNSGKTSSHNSNNANAKPSITPPAPSLCALTMEDAQKSQTQPQPLHKTYKQASSNPHLSQKNLPKIPR